MGKTRKKTHAPPFMQGRRHDGAAFVLSHNALERFRERVCPQFSIGRARYEARALVASAVKTPNNIRGDEVWLATNGAPVRFIVRNEGGRRTCVTVLAAQGPNEPEDAGDG